MKALKIVLKILVGIVVLIFALVMIYIIGCKIADSHNKKFPEKYIAEKYPDAEILSSGWTGGFMFDKGDLYYELLDKNTGMKFYQNFAEKGIFNWLTPDDNYNSYDQRLKQFEQENQLMETAEGCLEAESFMVHNPLESAGIVIVTKNESAQNINALMQALDDKISEQNTMMFYTIISCGDRLYQKIGEIDFEHFKSAKTGPCDFYDIADKLGLDYERITAKNLDKYNIQPYELNGDPNDENYIPPENFDETAVCISWTHFWVFGLNY